MRHLPTGSRVSKLQAAPSPESLVKVGPFRLLTSITILANVELFLSLFLKILLLNLQSFWQNLGVEQIALRKNYKFLARANALKRLQGKVRQLSTFAAFSKSGFSGQLNSKFQTSGQIDHQMPQCAVCIVQCAVCSVQCAVCSVLQCPTQVCCTVHTVHLWETESSYSVSTGASLHLDLKPWD